LSCSIFPLGAAWVIFSMMFVYMLWQIFTLILLFIISIFGSKSWIMNLVYEESQSLFLISLVHDGKNMEVPKYLWLCSRAS
jgi:hypothetical protein